MFKKIILAILINCICMFLNTLGSRLYAQMRTSLPSPSTLSYLSLIDKVSAAKAIPRKKYKLPSHALRRDDQGIGITCVVV